MRSAILISLLLSLSGLAFAQDTNFSTGPQYLMTSGSQLLARPIATPSLSLGGAPPASSAAGEGVQLSPSAPNPSPANLYPIYYGEPQTSESVVIEITSSEPSQPLPPSINVGVSAFTNPGYLFQQGYGVGVAEAASIAKARKSPAAHLYTNRDIERLHAN